MSAMKTRLVDVGSSMSTAGPVSELSGGLHPPLSNEHTQTDGVVGTTR